MTHLPITRWLLGMLIGTACLVLAGQALADDYPSQPIRVIVPYGPGGVDLQIRAMAPSLSEILGQQVVVENRAGGGATIGAAAVKNAPPNGYTLLFTGTAALAIVPQTLASAPYSINDFAVVGNVTGTPLVIAVGAQAPYTTLEELLKYAKANPGKVNMGSSGPGTTMHMAGEAFQLEAGVEFTHVPYKGVAPAVQAVLGGYADIVFGVPGAIAPQVQAGKMRVLATMGTERSSFFPDAPTLKEKGINLVEVTRFGLFAPRDTPAPILKKLEDAVAKIVSSKPFEETMLKGKTNALYLKPADLEAAVAAEHAYWEKTLRLPRFDNLMNR